MFSSSLVLGDMDYIAPSQACIKPTMAPPTPAAAGSVFRHDGKEAPPPEMLKITLQDCLACSGCVTSAETMLVTSQSKEELIAILDSQKLAVSGSAIADAVRRAMIVTISEQSISSVAAHLGITSALAETILAEFSRQVLLADVVLGLQWAQVLSTKLTFADYARRVLLCPEQLPILVSSCPGWVCYCEKQYPELLPHLSPVLSPQGIAGSLIRSALEPMLSETQSDVYHISIQPCFDRKLEAARDAVHPPTAHSEEAVAGARLTDCVLSTHEVLEWMQELDPTMQRFQCTSGPGVMDGARVAALLGVSGEAAVMCGSGGYHLYSLLSTAHTLQRLPQFSLERDVQYETKRNANHRLVRTTADTTGMHLPKAEGCGAKQHLFTVAYGFQHIQNLVRGMRRKTSTSLPYTFVEIMACPSGCLNGGGQVRVGTGAVHDERLAAVQSTYASSSHSHDSAATIASWSPMHEALVRHLSERVAEVDALLSAIATSAAAASGEDEEASGAALVLPAWCTAVFHDRKKDMEAMLNANPLHSLKW